MLTYRFVVRRDPQGRLLLDRRLLRWGCGLSVLRGVWCVRIIGRGDVRQWLGLLVALPGRRLGRLPVRLR